MILVDSSVWIDYFNGSNTVEKSGGSKGTGLTAPAETSPARR